MSGLGHNSDEIDFKKIRSEFPILNKKVNNKDLVYLEDHGECEVIGISLLERDYQIYNQDNFKSIKNKCLS